MTVAVPGGRFVAALALVVLLGASLLPIASVEAAAWRFDHGHITLGAVVPDHDHPWDRGETGSHAHDHHHHGESADGEADSVVFTLDDEGTPSVMPPVEARLGLLPGVTSEVEVEPAVRLAGVAVGVEAPPPRA